MDAPQLMEYIPRIPDLYEAELMLVREIQAKHFPEEIDLLLRIGIRDPDDQPELRKRNSSLLSINPFVDAQGVLRAGGHLEFSTLRSYDRKHPMILPSHQEAVESLIRKEHVQQLQAGVNHIMASLRKKFFIIGGCTTVGQVIAKCIMCKKAFKKLQKQKMAPLSVERLDVCVPFEATGADLFGPFSVVHGGRATTKCWVLLFMCMACRAVHLEMLNDMSAQTTINAIIRFQSKRPGIKTICCYNGTNLTGAKTELDGAIEEWNESELADSLRLKGIEWKFGPPNASHWGGIYERMVQSAKKHLKLVLTREAVDVDVFTTLFRGVESVLNNHPLTIVTADSKDVDALTPFNFLCPGVTMALNVHIISPAPPGSETT
jgi:hypothetical protein